MTDTSTGDGSRDWLKSLAVACGGYAALGGLVSLAGWMFHVPRLTDWNNDGITIKANAAICAMGAGAAVVYAHLIRPRWRRGALVLALPVLIIAALTLFEHLAGATIGLDTLFFAEPEGAKATAAPGRMGLPASTAFSMLGVCILLLGGGPRARRWAARLGLFVVVLAALSLVGYLYGARGLYAIPGLTGIALQTATMVAALGVAVVASVPEQGAVTLLRSPDAGGITFRQLGLPVILLPIFIGWIRIEGERHGLYNARFGTAARTIVEIILLSLLLWWTANRVGRHSQRALRADETVRQSEGLLRTVTTEARVGLVLVNKDRRYLFGNATYAEILGLPSDDIVGKRVQDVLGGLYEQAAPRLDRAFAGENVRYELHQSRHPRTGDERFYEVTYQPRIVNARAEEVVVVITDITTGKRAEEVLRQADRRKDEFLATLAHELRNPLAPLRTGVDLLQRGALDGAGTIRVLGMMDRQLTQTVRLVDDLLDISRLTTGKIDLRREQVPLVTALESAVETCGPVLRFFDHQLTFNSAAPNVFVDGDPTRLAQIFVNLLNNAAKYTDRGGRIEITVESTADHSTVHIRDSGPGIPAAMIPHIFEMFTQVHTSVERTRSGLGIGLALVRRLAEIHGGAVELISPPSRPSATMPPHGTEAVVRLPTVTRVVPLPIQDRESAATVAVSPEPEQRAHPGLRILIADDNTDAAETISDLLAMFGHQTVVVGDGLQAVAQTAAFSPHVAILDIGMPQIDGYEAARRIRASPLGAQITLIALTGWGQEGDRQKSRAAGFDHHLVKPVDASVIEKMLADLPFPVA